MKIRFNKDKEKVIAEISGRIDTSTSPELLEQLKGVMDGIKELVLDFKEVEYISSAGLRVLLFAQKTMVAQGNMTLINVNDNIMEVFDLTGFTEILNIQK